MPVSCWMRRCGQPSRPSAMTCCRFSSLKTLLTSMEANPSIVLNVLPISIGRFSAVPHWPLLGVPRGWCRLNSVELTITFSEESYVCRVIEGSPVNVVIESHGSSNLCFELLVVCTTLAEKMKTIEPPYASRTWADFIEGRPKD